MNFQHQRNEKCDFRFAHNITDVGGTSSVSNEIRHALPKDFSKDI